MGNVFKVNYNSEEYEQILNVSRTKSGDNDGGKIIFSQPLDNQLVAKIEIISDIRTIILQGSLTYKDVGRKFMHKIISDGYTFLEIIIKKTDGYNTSSSIEHTFIITNNKLIDKEEDLYELELISIDWYKFDNRIIYSTTDNNDSQAKLSATEIMYQLMKKNEFNINKPKINSKDKFHYLTPAGYSLQNSLEYMYSIARDSDNSMFFIAFDHNTATYEIKSLKELIRTPEDIYQDNQLIFPDADSGVTFPQRNINFLTMASYISFDDIINSTKPSIIRYHNYDTRKWEQNTLKRETINNFFPPPNIKGFNTRFKDVPKYIKSDVRNEIIEKLGTDFKIEDQFREIFYLTESIQGNTHGVLRRKAGELLFIRVNAESNYYYRFIGAWFVTRIFHKFTRNTYENVIQACRTDVASELDREKK